MPHRCAEAPAARSGGDRSRQADLNSEVRGEDGRVWLSALASLLPAGVGCCAVTFKGAQMKKILGGLLLAFAFAVPQAYAGLVSTDQAAAQQEREHVKALIQRPEVAQQMEKMGIPAKEALVRVDAMTDEEVRSLAGRLDALPAGGQDSTQTPPPIFLLIIPLLLFLEVSPRRSP